MSNVLSTYNHIKINHYKYRKNYHTDISIILIINPINHYQNQDY